MKRFPVSLRLAAALAAFLACVTLPAVAPGRVEAHVAGIDIVPLA